MKARGGRLACVGLPAENDLEVPIFRTVLGGLGPRAAPGLRLRPGGWGLVRGWEGAAEGTVDALEEQVTEGPGGAGGGVRQPALSPSTPRSRSKATSPATKSAASTASSRKRSPTW